MLLAIGPAAERIDVAAHVLRHWEDVGVLVPLRTATGHRRYDEERVARGRLIRLCQRAGLSLADIRALYRSGNGERAALIEGNRTRIVAAISQLQQAERFLAHTLECAHPMVSQCPQCTDFCTTTI
jgi:MerR family copper efflux transcriptional regulator